MYRNPTYDNNFSVKNYYIAQIWHHFRQREHNIPKLLRTQQFEWRNGGRYNLDLINNSEHSSHKWPNSVCKMLIFPIGNNAHATISNMHDLVSFMNCWVCKNGELFRRACEGWSPDPMVRVCEKCIHVGMCVVCCFGTGNNKPELNVSWLGALSPGLREVLLFYIWKLSRTMSFFDVHYTSCFGSFSAYVVLVLVTTDLRGALLWTFYWTLSFVTMLSFRF
jgi:hypothetical protein